MKWTKDPKYEPRTRACKLALLTEEAGEVQAAVGKLIRFGGGGVDPRLPGDKVRTNRQALLDELKDLEMALQLVREALSAL